MAASIIIAKIAVNLIWAILILIIMFTKNPITDLISTFSKKGKLQYKNFNLELGRDAQYTSQQDQKSIKLQKINQSQLVTDEEETIRNQLLEFNDEQAKNILIHHLASANVLILLLCIDKSLLIQQKQVLMYLNTNFKICSEDDLLPFYENCKVTIMDSHSEYSFDIFLNFLINANLITRNSDGYSITLLGQEYLNFLIRTGQEIQAPSF